MPSSHSQKTLIYASILIVVVFCVGIPSITNRFQTHSTLSKYLIPLTAQSDNLVSQMLFPKNEQKFFRPLWGVTMCLDYTIWHLNAAGFHLTNLLIHTASAIILFLILKRLFPPGAAFLSALMFGIHPVSVASYAIIDHRGDVLCTLFFLLAFLFADIRLTGPQRVEFLKSWVVEVMGWVSFCLALLSKETAVSLPVIVALHGVLLRRNPLKTKNKLRLILPWFAIAILYLGIRFYTLGEIGGYHAGQSHFVYDYSTFKNFGDILCAVSLQGSYGPHSKAAIIITLSLFLSITIRFFRQTTLVFCSAWMVTTAFLTISIARPVFLHTDYARFAYLPLVGVAFCFGYLVNRISSKNVILPRYRWTVLITSVLFYACLSFLSLKHISNLNNCIHAVQSDIVRKILAGYPDIPPDTTLCVINNTKKYSHSIFWTPAERKAIINKINSLVNMQANIPRLLLRASVPKHTIHYTEIPAIPPSLEENEWVFEYTDGTLIRHLP